MTRKNSPPSSPKAPSGRAERAGRGAQAPRGQGAQASGPSRGRASAPERRAPSKRLMNIVPVQLRANFTRSECDAQEMMLEVGQEVIVETPRGPVLATVRGPIQRKYLMAEGVLRVVRKATPEDVEQAIAYERREQDAYRFAIERIRARDLPMKLVRAQFLLDGSKLVYFFSAEGRVDFRELVKDLAHRFRARIEMHQIGVRDGARMLGGVGPCGRELCCSTFLESFAPVSIRMAKDQGLTLNPKKVSGMCGRLMCCLVYEQQLYRSMRRRVPRPGTVVFTEAGKGVITSVDVMAATAQVELEDMNRRVFPLVELASSEPRQREVIDAAPAPAPPALNPDLLWEDVLRDFDEELVRDAGLLEPSEQVASEERTGRRGRSRRRKKDEPVTSAALAEASSASSEASPSLARPARPARPAKPASARPAPAKPTPAKPARPAPARGRQAPPAQASSPQGQASPGEASASGVVEDAQGQRRKRPRRGRRGDAQPAASLNQPAPGAPVGARPPGGAESAAEPASQSADRRAKTRRPRGQGRAQERGTAPQSQSQPQPQSAQPQPRPRAEGKGEARPETRAEGRSEGAERRRRPRRRKKEEGAQGGGGDKAD